MQQLLAESDQLLSGRQQEVPVPELTFRDYVTARRAISETAHFQRDRAYWRKRAETLPGAPELPLAAANARASQSVTTFSRYERPVEAAHLEALERRARERDLSLSSVLMTAYALTIARWSRNRAFTLTVPTFGRLPLHPDVTRLVGDFTTIELLEVDLTARRSITEHARAVAGRLLEDLIVQ